MADRSAWGRYVGLGFVLPAAAFVGLAVGYAVDAALGTGKVFQLILLFVGIAAGFVEIYRAAFRK